MTLPSDRRKKPPIPLPVGYGLSKLYGIAITARNRRFDKEQGVTHIDAPVISIGNLSVGGTGKTPCVRAICQIVASLGGRPGIAMRGYKAQQGSLSDEQMEYELLLPGVPVSAHSDRIQAANTLLQEHNCDVVVLDDGFQHRRLGRDCDIVLIDATRSAFRDRLLPAGWLREPVTSLRRADAVILTRSDMTTPTEAVALEHRIRCITGNETSVSKSRHTWSCVREYEGVGLMNDALPVNALKGLSLVLACGIGHPAAFKASAQSHGVTLAAEHTAHDHHHWSTNDIDKLASQVARTGAAGVLTTMKDWVKIKRLALEQIGTRFYIPTVEMEFLDSTSSIHSTIARVIAST